jgi:hypothetical protein
MSIAAPTTPSAPQPTLASADASDLPGGDAGSRCWRSVLSMSSDQWPRLARWLQATTARLRRATRAFWESAAPRVVASCGISIAAHAALVGALALCTHAIRKHEAPALVTEIQQLRPMPATLELRMPDQLPLPEVAQPAGAGASGSTAIMRGKASIDPATFAPHIEPVMLALSRSQFTAIQPPSFDRELAPERRAATKQPQAQGPAEQAVDDGRTVIELPAGFQGMGGMFAGRQPVLKRVLIKQLGGTDETEAAVKRGLEWLKKHQQPDGRWCLHAFGSLPDCHGQCTHPGILSDTGGTALAVLPFLAAGSTHLEGEHAPVVSAGLAFLLNSQKSDGGWADGGIVKMYAHGLSTIALSEAYAMTGDPRFREPIEKAIDIIAEYQDEEGGWRYVADQIGDNSVTGWQLMALRSAQSAGIKVPKKMFSRAMAFLDTVQPDKSRGLFSYGEDRPVTETMTAEGLLSREYGGWAYENLALRAGVAELLRSYMPVKEKPNMYYWYYATQTLHHVGGKSWEKWNEPMRQILVDLQIKEGHMTGSWTPKAQYDLAGGRLYMTALATLTLEVYYRHMPIYARYSTGGAKGKQPQAN